MSETTELAWLAIRTIFNCTEKKFNSDVVKAIRHHPSLTNHSGNLYATTASQVRTWTRRHSQHLGSHGTSPPSWLSACTLAQLSEARKADCGLPSCPSVRSQFKYACKPLTIAMFLSSHSLWWVCRVCICFQNVGTQWMWHTSGTKRNQVLFSDEANQSQCEPHLVDTDLRLSAGHKCDPLFSAADSSVKQLELQLKYSCTVWHCYQHVSKPVGKNERTWKLNTWKYDDICSHMRVNEWYQLANGQRIYHFFVRWCYWVLPEAPNGLEPHADLRSCGSDPSKWDLDEGLPLRTNIGHHSTFTSSTKTYKRL